MVLLHHLWVVHWMFELVKHDSNWSIIIALKCNAKCNAILDTTHFIFFVIDTVWNMNIYAWMLQTFLNILSTSNDHQTQGNLLYLYIRVIQFRSHSLSWFSFTNDKNQKVSSFIAAFTDNSNLQRPFVRVTTWPWLPPLSETTPIVSNFKHMI